MCMSLIFYFQFPSILTSGNMSSNEMRQLAASSITSEPHKYSDAVLGRPRDEYVQWILKDESWGGECILEEERI